MASDQQELGTKSHHASDAQEKRQHTPAPNLNATGDIPNGGLVAWLQVVGSFFLFFNSWGIVNTFGAFQTYYERDLLYHKESHSNISWIGSIQACLLIIFGVVTGPLYDRGYFRHLIYTGSLLIVFGMMMTSLCTEYWQLMLAQGLVVGLGCGCAFLPSVAILPMYFTSRKSLVQGIAATGTSFGGIIYPIVFRRLQSRLGFPWATRIIAFIALGTLVIPLTSMKVRIQLTGRRHLFEGKAWKEKPYLLFGVAVFFAFMGMYIPFFYISLYAAQRGGTSENLAFYLLPILNAGSIFGRILANFCADKAGPFNMLVPCSVAATVLALSWIAVNNTAGLIVFCLLYGFFSGTLVSLPPATVVTLCPTLGVVGVRMGMNFAAAGLGLLVGNPIAGAILGHGDSTGSWNGLKAFNGGMIALAGLFVVGARVAKVGWRLHAVA